MARRNNSDDLKDAIADFGKLPLEVRREVRPVLRKSASRPLSEVRGNASWSSRIPRATTIRVSFSKRNPGVALTVNKNKAPHARAYENLGKKGTFRAPLFGDRTKWISHQARPFFFQVGEPWLNDVDAAVGEVVDRVTHRMKFG